MERSRGGANALLGLGGNRPARPGARLSTSDTVAGDSPRWAATVFRVTGRGPVGDTNPVRPERGLLGATALVSHRKPGNPVRTKELWGDLYGRLTSPLPDVFA